MTTNTERTLAFIAAWEAKDIEAIVDMAAPDIVYHNIPMDPMIGRDALRAGITAFIGLSDEVDWETLHIAETGAGVVLTERVDRFTFTNGRSMALRVMGTFEWNDEGKLARWRDYFDLAQFQSQMPQ